MFLVGQYVKMDDYPGIVFLVKEIQKDKSLVLVAPRYGLNSKENYEDGYPVFVYPIYDDYVAFHKWYVSNENGWHFDRVSDKNIAYEAWKAEKESWKKIEVKTKNSKREELLVKCEHCKTPILKGKAVVLNGKYYCCHRNKNCFEKGLEDQLSPVKKFFKHLN